MWLTYTDSRKLLYVAPSILEYLKNHNAKLKNQWYNKGNDKEPAIEAYPRVPTDRGAYGSMTVSRGVKVVASAFYNH